MNGDNEIILDTVIVESLWTGGEGIQWLSRVANGEVAATISAASVAELARIAPDRRAEIQLTALLMLPVKTLDVDAAIARRAGADRPGSRRGRRTGGDAERAGRGDRPGDGTSHSVRGRRLLCGYGMRDRGVGITTQRRRGAEICRGTQRE